MTRMVDDMFELALADLDARPLQLEEVYLDEIVNECVVGGAGSSANDRAVTVAARTPPDVQMQADQSLLRQMILNLVENAVRHTPAGGSVQVAVDADADRAQIAVSDTGPGVPASDRERIFERFVRLDASGSDGGGGLGLPSRAGSPSCTAARSPSNRPAPAAAASSRCCRCDERRGPAPALNP